MENIPRHKAENPFNYTDLELAKRKKGIIDAIKDYPHISPAWIEMAYDIVENNDFDELKKKIDESKPKERENGGILNNVTIENKSEFETAKSD